MLSVAAGICAGAATVVLLATINQVLNRPGGMAGDALLLFVALCALALVRRGASDVSTNLVGRRLVAQVRKSLAQKILAALSPLLFAMLLVALVAGTPIQSQAQARGMQGFWAAQDHEESLHKAYRGMSEGAKALRLHRARCHCLFEQRLVTSMIWLKHQTASVLTRTRSARQMRGRELDVLKKAHAMPTLSQAAALGFRGSWLTGKHSLVMIVLLISLLTFGAS